MNIDDYSTPLHLRGDPIYQPPDFAEPSPPRDHGALERRLALAMLATALFAFGVILGWAIPT